MKNWDKYQFGGLAESLNAMRTYSPTYTPNPAYTAGMMFEYGAKDPAAVTGVIGDLLTQNLASFLSGWNFQQEPQRASMAKDGGMYYQKGGMVDQHLYGMDPRLANDPTKMGYDFDFRQTQNRAAQAQVQQPLNNMQSQNMFFPTLGERNRFSQAASILSTDNPNLSPTANTVNKAIGGASALTSGLFDMTKDVLSGIGTARQNQYAAKRAAEQMREATINQGFEQGRQDLFNQGYLQQGNLQFVQDGGTIYTQETINNTKNWYDSLTLEQKGFVFMNPDKYSKQHEILFPLDTNKIDKKSTTKKPIKKEEKSVNDVEQSYVRDEKTDNIMNKVSLVGDVLQFNPATAALGYGIGLIPTAYSTYSSLREGDYKQAGIDALGFVPYLKYAKKANTIWKAGSKIPNSLEPINKALNYISLGNDVAQEFQEGGSIPVSKYGMYQYPNQPVVVPSNNITMQGINKPVMAYPNGDQPQVMLPDQKYNFPNSTNVLEVPLIQNGGMIKLANGVYFDNNTQEFVVE